MSRRRHVIEQSPILILPAPTSPKNELPSYISANSSEILASVLRPATGELGGHRTEEALDIKLTLYN